MDNLIYSLFISVFIPILLLAVLVDKKSRLPISFMLIGIFMSLFASEINALLYKHLNMDMFEITTIVTPVCEEILKALPILFFAIVVSDKRDTLLTAAMATGIGFGVLENAFFLVNSDSFNLLDAIIRAFGTALMHGMCTLLVGVGISFIRQKKKTFEVGTFALLSTAITYHGIYNMLVQSEYSIVGALLPIATYIPCLIWQLSYKRSLKKSQDSSEDTEKSF